MMVDEIALATATLAVFALLLWLAGRRIGVVVLGGAWAALACCLVIAGLAVGYLEPNFGPYSPKAGLLLAALGVILGTGGLFFARRLGAWLVDPVTGRRISWMHRVALGLGLSLTLAASLHARGRPAVAPDLAPLVVFGSQPATTVGGDLRVTIEARPTALDASTPRPSGWAEPDAICYVVISDELAGKTYEAANLGKTQRMSGSRSCPAATVTIDPSRRTVHLEQAELFWSTTSAWRFPGLRQTSTAIWTCRRGRLLAVPRDWLDVAWLGLGTALVVAGAGARLRRTARRFDGAIEAFHEGDGVLLLSDGSRAVLIEHAAVPIGAVTLVGAMDEQRTAYRAEPRFHAGAVIPSRLADLTGSTIRRACLAEVLGLLAVCLGLAPTLVAITAILA
jgi:hypothetical protein